MHTVHISPNETYFVKQDAYLGFVVYDYNRKPVSSYKMYNGARQIADQLDATYDLAWWDNVCKEYDTNIA